MEIQSFDGVGLLRELLPILLAALAALVAAKLFVAPRKADQAHRAPRQAIQTDLKLAGPDVPTLTFFGDQLKRFEDEVRRIYAVNHDKPPFGRGMKNLNGPVPPCDVKESIRQMRAACADLQEPVTGGWRLHEPLDDIFYTRFLTAVDFHQARALQLIRNYVKFRREMRGGTPPDYSWLKAGLGIVPFEDVMGRPIIVARAKYFDSQISAETFRSFYRGMVDSIIAHLLMKRRPQLSDTNPFEQYVLVLDVLGATRRNFSMTAIQVMIHESNNYYPDRVAQIFVLGVNLAVRSLWSLVSPMVMPRTRKKTELIKEADVPNLMRQLVGHEKLPEEYGGSAPRLPSPAQAKTLSDMAGPIPADIWEKLGAVRMLEEKTAMASKICVAWDMPPYGFRQMSSFKLWLHSRGESTAITRTITDCADFLTDLQQSADLKKLNLDLPKRDEGYSPSGWLSTCCSIRPLTDEEWKARQATRQPEVFARSLGKILAESQGAASRAVLDFVSGSGPYGIPRRLD